MLGAFLCLRFDFDLGGGKHADHALMACTLQGRPMLLTRPSCWHDSQALASLRRKLPGTFEEEEDDYDDLDGPAEGKAAPGKEAAAAPPPADRPLPAPPGA